MIACWRYRTLMSTSFLFPISNIIVILFYIHSIIIIHSWAYISDKRISIYFFNFYKWINFYKVLSLSVSISSKVNNPSLLHLGSLIALTSSLVSPYLILFYSICLFLSSFVGLLLVFMMKLFFLVTSFFFILSLNTSSRFRCNPMKSPRDCWPNNLWVCM